MFDEKKVSKAQQKAVAKYMKANYDEIKIRVAKGSKEKIQSHASSMSLSTNTFITQAIDEKMERESSTPAATLENTHSAAVITELPEPQEKEQIYTIENIYNLPEGQRAELIDGQIYYMAAPSTTHQRISNYLSTEINLYIRKNKGSCEVFPAPFAVFLNKDDKTYLEPDISVICDPDKLNDKGCNGAPDWIIEITSPSTASKDYLLKSTKYQEAGVKEYWIVNSSNETITVYYFANDEFTPRTYTFKDKIKVNIYDDLVIDFNDINI